MRSAFIDRRNRPFGGTPHQPDIWVKDMKSWQMRWLIMPTRATESRRHAPGHAFFVFAPKNSKLFGQLNRNCTAPFVSS